MNRDLYLAILSMDSYNRGYDPGIEDLPEFGQIGNATIGKTSADLEDADGNRLDIPAGFYAIAYDVSGVKVTDGAGFSEGERVMA